MLLSTITKNMNKNNQKGFMALTSILIISAISLGIAVSISLLGVGESKSSLALKKGQEALTIAQACGEESLFRLKKDSTYTSGSLNVGNGTCNISVTGSGADRTVDVIAHISDLSLYEKKIRLVVKLSGTAVNLISWQEIP